MSLISVLRYPFVYYWLVKEANKSCIQCGTLYWGVPRDLEDCCKNAWKNDYNHFLAQVDFLYNVIYMTFPTH